MITAGRLLGTFRVKKEPHIDAISQRLLVTMLLLRIGVHVSSFSLLECSAWFCFNDVDTLTVKQQFKNILSYI